MHQKRMSAGPIRAAVGAAACLLSFLVLIEPAEAQPAFKHCRSQEGMGIMSEDSVLFCTRVYGRTKTQAQIDVLQRAVKVFDERCESHLDCQGLQRKIIRDENKCLTSRRFSVSCQRRVELQAVRQPLQDRFPDDDPRLLELTQLILDDQMKAAAELAMSLAGTIAEKHAESASFDPLLTLAGDIEVGVRKPRVLANVPGAKDVNRFRLVAGSLLDRFHEKRGRMPTAGEFANRVADSNLHDGFAVEDFQLESPRSATMRVALPSRQVRFFHRHQVEPEQPKLTSRRKLSQHLKRIPSAPPDTGATVVEYADYPVFLLHQHQRLDYKTYSVLAGKDRDWLQSEMAGQPVPVQAKVLSRDENYQDRVAGMCVIDKERAHYLDFVNAARDDTAAAVDMKWITPHYPRFADEHGIGDEAVLHKVAASTPADSRLFRYANQGYLAEANYVVGYEGPLVVAALEISASLADRIQNELPDHVELHDHREDGLSDYRLTACYVSGESKTHYLVWRDMGLMPVGAPYAKRIFQDKRIQLALEDERLAERAMLCRILEHRRFPHDIPASLEQAVRQAAGLNCDADIERFLALVESAPDDPSLQAVRARFDQQ